MCVRGPKITGKQSLIILIFSLPGPGDITCSQHLAILEHIIKHKICSSYHFTLWFCKRGWKDHMGY